MCCLKKKELFEWQRIHVWLKTLFNVFFWLRSFCGLRFAVTEWKESLFPDTRQKKFTFKVVSLSFIVSHAVKIHFISLGKMLEINGKNIKWYITGVILSFKRRQTLNVFSCQVSLKTVYLFYLVFIFVMKYLYLTVIIITWIWTVRTNWR